MRRRGDPPPALVPHGSTLRETLAFVLAHASAVQVRGDSAQLDEDYLNLWEVLLSDLDPEDVAAAFVAWMKGERFFPTPADIRAGVERIQSERARVLEFLKARERAEARERARAAEESAPEHERLQARERLIQVRNRLFSLMGIDKAGPSG